MGRESVHPAPVASMAAVNPCTRSSGQHGAVNPCTLFQWRAWSLLESSILVLFLWKQLAVSAAVPGRQQSRQFAILDLDTGWWRQAPTFFAGPPVVSMRRARSVYCLLTWFDMAGGQPQLQICSYMNGQPEGFHMLREIPLACRPSPVETALSYDGDRDRLVVTGQQSLLLFTGFSDPQLIGLSASPVRQLHHEIRLLTEEHQVSAVAHCPQADWFAVRILQLERSGQRRRCSQLISVNKESLSILPVTDELPAEVECLIADSTGSRLFLSLRWSPIIARVRHRGAALLPLLHPGRPRAPVVSESLLCDAETAANCEAVAASSAISRRRRPAQNAAFVSRLGLEPGTGLLLAGRSVGDVVALRTDGPEAGNVWTVADPDCGQAPAGFALGRVSRLLVSDSGGGVGAAASAAAARRRRLLRLRCSRQRGAPNQRRTVGTGHNGLLEPSRAAQIPPMPPPPSPGGRNGASTNGPAIDVDTDAKSLPASRCAWSCCSGICWCGGTGGAAPPPRILSRLSTARRRPGGELGRCHLRCCSVRLSWPRLRQRGSCGGCQGRKGRRHGGGIGWCGCGARDGSCCRRGRRSGLSECAVLQHGRPQQVNVLRHHLMPLFKKLDLSCEARARLRSASGASASGGGGAVEAAAAAVGGGGCCCGSWGICGTRRPLLANLAALTAAAAAAADEGWRRRRQWRQRRRRLWRRRRSRLVRVGGVRVSERAFLLARCTTETARLCGRSSSIVRALKRDLRASPAAVALSVCDSRGGDRSGAPLGAAGPRTAGQRPVRAVVAGGVAGAVAAGRRAFLLNVVQQNQAAVGPRTAGQGAMAGVAPSTCPEPSHRGSRFRLLHHRVLLRCHLLAGDGRYTQVDRPISCRGSFSTVGCVTCAVFDTDGVLAAKESLVALISVWTVSAQRLGGAFVCEDAAVDAEDAAAATAGGVELPASPLSSPSPASKASSPKPVGPMPADVGGAGCMPVSGGCGPSGSGAAPPSLMRHSTDCSSGGGQGGGEAA
uniref:MMS1_N domain-containing protein n=1 Tax=Macrostomum lignano TaxID=282301 RepID=A0A1I8F2N5_9PLAT